MIEPELESEPDPEQLFTSKQAARLLNVSTTSLYRARLAGLLGYQRNGERGWVRYSRQDLADYAVRRDQMIELGLVKPRRQSPRAPR